MKILLSLCCFLFLSLSTQAQSIEGKWLVEKKEAYVVIYKRDGLYYGKVYKIGGQLTSDGKPLLDIKNPNKAKRNRAIQGLEFLTGFTPKGNEFVNGKIYDSRSGKTYDGKMWLENGTLKLRGYLGVFYETRTWTRIK